MAKLHPTLWRTCRILSGKTRLQLFRRVIATPDQSVTALAKQLDISVPRTSQELRRLQSRGLLQAVRRNQNVLYRPVPDALVSTAAPLLAAMQQTFQRYPESRDDETARIATGLAHTRRLVLMRLLLVSPMDEQTLEDLSGIKRDALLRHLKLLEQAGLACCRDERWQVVDSSHPLAQCLLALLVGERKRKAQPSKAAAN